MTTRHFSREQIFSLRGMCHNLRNVELCSEMWYLITWDFIISYCYSVRFWRQHIITVLVSVLSCSAVCLDIVIYSDLFNCGNKMPTRCNRWFLLQILLLAQHVSGTTMPIIRTSRLLYRWLLPVVLGALVFKLSVWCGAEGYVSGSSQETRHVTNQSTKYHRQQPPV
jgi:hypothetical protein